MTDKHQSVAFPTRPSVQPGDSGYMLCRVIEPAIFWWTGLYSPNWVTLAGPNMYPLWKCFLDNFHHLEKLHSYWKYITDLCNTLLPTKSYQHQHPLNLWSTLASSPHAQISPLLSVRSRCPWCFSAHESQWFASNLSKASCINGHWTLWASISLSIQWASISWTLNTKCIYLNS